jgi:cytochrome c biogenesis protein CcmG/thiol:disulfide interchange protein DsbE
MRSVLFAFVAVAGLAVVGVLALAVRSAGARPTVTAPAFRLPVLGQAGSQVSLASYAGQPVIVNFFASWCPPCKAETPLLARFYAAHHGKIKIIGIDSGDETAPALKFVLAQHVAYPVAVDAFPSKAAADYGVSELPQTFFLNARHQLVRHIAGAVTARELAAWAAQLG